MVTQNPNWPLVDEALSFQTGPNSAPRPPYWVSVRERTEGTWSASRGKQYQLDQYQTGTSSVTLNNTDGAFTPANSSSPYYPNVVPYRGYRKRFQYPATINLLTAAQATAGAVANDDGTPVVAGGLPYNVAAGGIYPVAVTSGHVYSSSLPSSPVNGTVLTQVTGWSVPGFISGGTASQVTAQCTVTASVSTSLKLAIVWVDVTGATISTTTGTPATVTTSHQLTVTGTPPSGCAGAILELVLNSSPGTGPTVTSVNWQIEANTSASSYVQPGTWYSIFTGLTLASPQDWADAGTYGTVTISLVDVFGWLSQKNILSPAYMELLALGPTWLYCLDEESNASLFYDATGSQQPMRSQYVGGGTPSANLLTPGAALTQPQTAYGIGGPVVTFNNPASPGVAEVLNLGAALNESGPSTSVAWSRVFHFRTSTSGELWCTSGAIPFLVGGTPVYPGYDLNVNGIYVGQLFWQSNIDLTHFYSITSAQRVDDGLWHQAIITCSADGKTVQMFIDGALAGTSSSADDQRPNTAGGVEFLGTQNGAPNNVSDGFQGDMSTVAEYPFVLTTDQVTAVYSTFRYGGSGDGTASSYSRWMDIVRWAQFNGPVYADNYATGETVQYGPATDLLSTRAAGGTAVVQAFQTVVDTENGTMFVAGNGTATLKARRSRYNPGTPVVVFGENTAGGEIPYVDTPLNFDPTRIANDAQISQTLTNNTVRFQDATSVATFGDFPLQRTINTLDAYELSDAAQYLVAKNAYPQQRLQKLTVPASSFTVNGAANAGAWAALLPLEIGSYVQWKRRPPGASVITLSGFVEQIGWNGDDVTNASVDLQISNANDVTFFEVGSTHTTVHTATTVGGTTLVIDPLPDAATNPIQANISSAGDSYEWVIAYGTANAELVTVTKPTPGTTGYATATLTVGTCMRLDTGATRTGFNFVHAINTVFQDIGGFESGPQWSLTNLAPLTALISPANALDAYATLDTSMLGY